MGEMWHADAQWHVSNGDEVTIETEKYDGLKTKNCSLVVLACRPRSRMLKPEFWSELNNCIIYSLWYWHSSMLVLPGSRARIVRCGGRYDPQLVKRSSEWVSEWYVSTLKSMSAWSQLISLVRGLFLSRRRLAAAAPTECWWRRVEETYQATDFRSRPDVASRSLTPRGVATPVPAGGAPLLCRKSAIKRRTLLLLPDKTSYG